MFCPQCGMLQVEGVVSCTRCGTLIPKPSTSSDEIDPPKPLVPKIDLATQPINVQTIEVGARPYNQTPNNLPIAPPTYDQSNVNKVGKNPYDDIAYPSVNISPTIYPQVIPPYAGVQPRSYYATPQMVKESPSPRALVGMILGLLSFATCWFGIVFSISSLVVSKIELNAIRRGQSPKAGETLAKVGFFSSLVYLVLFGLGIFFIFLGSHT